MMRINAKPVRIGRAYPARRTRAALVCTLAAVLATSVSLVGCGGAAPEGPRSPGAGSERGGVESSASSGVAAPAAPDLSTPLSSVKSYLDWTTYAYRIGDSDVATMAFSPAEEVRVNSYVQLNREKGRLIGQTLVGFAPGEAGIDGTEAVLPAREDWAYRYLSLDGAKALTPTYTATYDATYTLILVSPKRWLVDSVKVISLGEVK